MLRPTTTEALAGCAGRDAGVSEDVDLPGIPPLVDASILALDLGRRTGWAIERPGHEDSGVFELYDQYRGAKNYQDGARFEALRSFLNGARGQHGTTVVAFEDVHPATMRGNRQTQLYFGFRGVLMSWAAEHGLPVIPLPVGTVKKTMGKGNANKEEMIAAVRALGYPTYDENDADAIATLITLRRMRAHQIAQDAAAAQKLVDSERSIAHDAPSTSKRRSRKQAMAKTTAKPAKKAAKRRATKRAKKAA